MEEMTPYREAAINCQTNHALKADVEENDLPEEPPSTAVVSEHKPLSEEWLEEQGLAKFTTGTGQEILVHGIDKCSAKDGDRFCPVHSPSNHPLKDAPLHWRYDRKIFERMCRHGVGHPDPDTLSYIESVRGKEAADGEGIHGCDGCCSGNRLD